MNAKEIGRNLGRGIWFIIVILIYKFMGFEIAVLVSLYAVFEQANIIANKLEDKEEF